MPAGVETEVNLHKFETCHSPMAEGLLRLRFSSNINSHCLRASPYQRYQHN
ncbi:hypothetical protein M758_4G204800 [Ceratodon purpureus]|uniref:Uncharacterized protein n=1 Tax=Ceratodon purpureus TaxID=3225 RepID=A0A8T0IE96_CERPU|nr:hypothetical protein KC19_4G200700 [Ceratodon purpureus]KAG0620289.1 hypothetical protein M758_4G204700 [Ceratodon purpureus]KAG0620290.1 hypothetical protein M758_4G204800 [Ceratodon purpureus]